MFSLAKRLIVGNKAANFIDRFYLIIALAILVLSRLVPHPPNMTPFMAVTLSLAARFGPVMGLMISTTALLLSDIGLASLYHVTVWGGWSWFCYSAFLLPALLVKWLPVRWYYFVGASTGCGLGFWLWTNFGVWLQSMTYAHNLSGLLQCYKIALPFLANQMAGDGLCALALYGWLDLWQRRQALRLTTIREIST